MTLSKRVALRNKEAGVRYIYWVRSKQEFLEALLELNYAKMFAHKDMKEHYGTLLPYT